MPVHQLLYVIFHLSVRRLTFEFFSTREISREDPFMAIFDPFMAIFATYVHEQFIFYQTPNVTSEIENSCISGGNIWVCHTCASECVIPMLACFIAFDVSR